MPEPKKPFESGQPVSINTGFTCNFCGKSSPRAEKTCRNHCINCLYSLHVDAKIPGDRRSGCRGLMEPLYIDYQGKKGYQIIHKCLLCGKQSTNKAAPDDSPETIAQIMQRQNLEPLKRKKHAKK